MRNIEIKINEERNVRLTAYIQEAGGEFLFSKRPARVQVFFVIFYRH